MPTTDPPAAGKRERPYGRLHTSSLLVELVRLAVVVLATSAAFELTAPGAGPLSTPSETQRLLVVAVGVGVAYVCGGVLGRYALGRIDVTERRLRTIGVVELLATVLGALTGLVLGAALAWPVLLFDGRRFTVPLAALGVVLAVGTCARIGADRGGDLLRALGASGRLPVVSPSSGARARVVDTSALVDGRLLDVCRAGFLDGTLVVPRFVLYELQGLADAGDEERRARGRRGLDVLGALQRSAGVALEVAEQDHPELAEVDAKLIAMARQRGSAVITVDGNLGRVAEVQGVKVLNLHALAETLRPPVLPGDRLRLRIAKAGREAGQGIGYLADGTMVVVEGGRDHQGDDLEAEVTSVLSNANGRMVFATRVPAVRGLAGVAAERA